MPTGSVPVVVTEGNGWHEQPGDRAELDVGYAATGPDRATAVAELGRRVAAADPALQHPALEVRHRRLWVNAEWRDDRVVGCRAAMDIALVVAAAPALEEVLAALVATEPAQLHGPRWSLHDRSAARAEAQRRAVADARARAEGYAAAVGGRLGPLLALRELADEGPVAYRMAARAEAAPDVRDLGLEPEPVRVTARCATTWELLSSA
jgi:uncharacterized protein YggE